MSVRLGKVVDGKRSMVELLCREEDRDVVRKYLEKIRADWGRKGYEVEVKEESVRIDDMSVRFRVYFWPVKDEKRAKKIAEELAEGAKTVIESKETMEYLGYRTGTWGGKIVKVVKVVAKATREIIILVTYSAGILAASYLAAMAFGPAAGAVWYIISMIAYVTLLIDRGQRYIEEEGA